LSFRHQRARESSATKNASPRKFDSRRAFTTQNRFAQRELAGRPRIGLVTALVCVLAFSRHTPLREPKNE
jgi:hypothetical protein